MFPDFHFNLSACLRIVAEKLLGILSSLSDLGIMIGIPGTALHHYSAVGRQIQNIAHCGNPLPEHDIEFRFTERRSDLIFYNLYTGTVTDHLTALLQRFDPANVQPH